MGSCRCTLGLPDSKQELIKPGFIDVKVLASGNPGKVNNRHLPVLIHIEGSNTAIPLNSRGSCGC